MKKILCLLCQVLIYQISFSQVDTLNQDPKPQGGIEKLALEYYKIDFTKAQRKHLEDLELEFIYLIDANGIPTLEEVKGVNDPIILDSLYQASAKLPAFSPRLENGEPTQSLYFMKMQFPKYSPINSIFFGQDQAWEYREAKTEDFEYITKSGARLDILFGGVGNAFLGNANDYLKLGGGMKVDMLFFGKNKFGGGFMMNVYGNELKKDYPINSTREQNTAPPTLLLGLGVNRVLKQKARTELNAQLELSWAIHNITPRIDETDRDFVQFFGFSPGVVANYLIRIGKESTYYYYGRPSLLAHYVNIHAALRPLFYDFNEANGVMVEVGVSYRMINHYVSEYKLKHGF